MVAADKIDPAPKNPQFALAVRGYNQHQVDERVGKLVADLRDASKKRDEAMETVAELSKSLSYAQREVEDSKAGLVRMTSSPSGASAMAERVRMMMQLAEEEIAELRAKAEEDAKATREEAEKDAHATRRAAEKAIKDLQTAHDAQLEAARAENERSIREAAELREKQDADAKARREADLKAALDAVESKRAAAERAAADEEKAAKDRLGKIVSDAENRRATAEQQAKQAFEFRRRVTEQLSTTNTALQEALKHLVPLEGSQDQEPQNPQNQAPQAPQNQPPQAQAPKSVPAPQPTPRTSNSVNPQQRAK
jgi:colicin import membrane protein